MSSAVKLNAFPAIDQAEAQLENSHRKQVTHEPPLRYQVEHSITIWRCLDPQPQHSVTNKYFTCI